MHRQHQLQTFLSLIPVSSAFSAVHFQSALDMPLSFIVETKVEHL